MVPKRSKTSGSGKPGSAPRRRRRARTSSNVTPLPPPQATEPAQTAETDISSNATATTAEDPQLRPLNAADVTAIIGHERAELLQIQALLKCLYEVLLYADDDDSVMHADVANVCARLINESVGRLDKLLMRRCEPNSSDELDDSGVSESCGSEEE